MILAVGGSDVCLTLGLFLSITEDGSKYKGVVDAAKKVITEVCCHAVPRSCGRGV